MEFTVLSSLSVKPEVVIPTLRPISAELDILTRSDGSAIYIQGFCFDFFWGYFLLNFHI